MNRLGDETGKNGGNGGDGGQVSVIVGGKLSKNALITDRILEHLADSQKEWPGDFTDDITDFLCIVERENLVNYQPPSNMRVLEDIRKVQLTSFRNQVRRLRQTLDPGFDELHAALSNVVDVRGGMYGTGSRGSRKHGESGHQGDDQVPIIASIIDYDTLLRVKVCYAHPVQCRMLLDKAKQMFWSGSLDNKTRGTTILRRLQERLKPFVEISGSLSSFSFPQTCLVQAYREAEPRLCIVSGEEDDIPVSVKRLTTLASEAEMTLKHMMSGMDFYGKGPEEVPRGSFTRYRVIAEDFLCNLKSIEKTYKDWFNNGSDASAQLNAIRRRGELCETTTRLKKELITETISDLDLNAWTIVSLTEVFPAALQAVMDEAAKVAQKIKEKFTFSFDELVFTLSQVLFVDGDPSKVGTETISLLEQGLEKIEQDDGIQISKKYLLSKLHHISGSFKSLNEGYKILDGRVQLTDPGAEKLVAAKEELNKLLDNFEVSLRDDILKGVNEKFQTYIGKF